MSRCSSRSRLPQATPLLSSPCTPATRTRCTALCAAYWAAAPLLHHEDGLSVDELARALELGFKTAKTRLRYAMSKLRTCMGAYLPQKVAG